MVRSGDACQVTLDVCDPGVKESGEDEQIGVNNPNNHMLAKDARGWQ